MTFLPQYSQLMLLSLEKAEYQNRSQYIQMEEMATQREMERVEDEYSYIMLSDEDADPEDDPYYKRLQRLTQTHEYQQTAITNQVSAIEKMIEALNKSLNTDIKNSCGTQLGGS